MPKKLTLPPAANSLVVTIAYDGLCTFEFGIAAEIFALSRPEMGGEWYRYAVAGVDDGAMRATGGLRFSVDGGLELMDQASTIIVPGWRSIDAPVPEALIKRLQDAHGRGARILSFCSGAFVLAEAGLLAGKRATTHWRYVDELRRRYPSIIINPDVLYVDEGDILTAAGTASGLDLCLHLIRRDFGPKAANLVARRLVVPTHRDGGQAQYMRQAIQPVRDGSRIATLLDYLRESLEEEHTVNSLAQRVHMSHRTFLRRFEDATGTTPARWLLNERLLRARDLLEETNASIEEVASLTGFRTAATLRHHFRVQLSTTPNSYRSAFGKG